MDRRKSSLERQDQIYRAWVQCVIDGDTPTLENIAARIGTVKSVVLHHMRKMVEAGTMVELAAGVNNWRVPDWVVAEAKDRLNDHREKLD